MSKRQKHEDGSAFAADAPIGDAPAWANGQRAPALTPRQRWVKHINRRWQNFVKAARHLGNMANRASYEYTEVERDQLLEAMDKRVREVRDKYLLPLNQARTATPLFDYYSGVEDDD